MSKHILTQYEKAHEEDLQCRTRSVRDTSEECAGADGADLLMVEPSYLTGE